MRKTVDFRVLILATLFGFLGGALSSVGLPQMAFAQSQYPDKIVAHEFHVVDDRGELVGVFGASPVGPPRLGEIDPESQQPGEGRIILLRADGTVAESFPRPLIGPLASGTDR